MTATSQPQLVSGFPPGSIQVVELDFGARTDRTIRPDEVKGAWALGRFCWLDIDQQAGGAAVEPYLRDLGVNPQVLRHALEQDSGGRHDYYPDCLHLTLTAGLWVDGEFTPQHVELLIGEHFLITLRPGPVEFIEDVRRHYSQDFAEFAQTPSFLLYDCWDHLINSYKRLLDELDQRLGAVQGQIFQDVDDEIFARVSDLTRDVTALRKTLLASREVLHDIATRRSNFVAESAQPFLDRLVITVERMAADLTAEREMLAETLNLYMGMVSHRTNKIVNRLTILSTVFLPLSFLVSIYGTNFDMPEVKWRYGYLYLWGVVLLMAAGLLWFMRRRKWW